MKISMFIDNTKSITNQVKRLIKGSCDIYLEENSITQPEIKQTTPLKLKLIGSRIRVRLREQDLIEAILQSKRI